MQATARSHSRPVERGAPAPRENDRPASVPAQSRPAPHGALLRACRPRQWVKNVLVGIAPAAAGALTAPGVVLDTLGAFVAFCMVSSATYLVNDVRDREQDRRHPRKCQRPVAAGELSPRRAVRMAWLLAVLGVGVSVSVRPALGVVAVGYLALTISYSICWRHVAIADIVAVAGGFLLRAIAGGVAADVPLSRSFLVVASACALFVVTGKRHAEIVDDAAGATRTTLGRYSRPLLRRLLAGAAAIGCIAYARWAFARPELGPWLELSMVPFVMWLGRYGLMLRTGAGETPEELVLRDPVLLGLGALWAVLFLGGIYGAP